MNSKEYEEKAAGYFYSGLNCAQATALAFAKELGLDEIEVQNAMAGFGGGFSGRRENCGAISALVYIAGLQEGNYNPNNNQEKTAFYEKVRNAIEAFEKEFGTVVCKDLLEKYDVQVKTDPQERNEAYYRSRPCDRFIKKAASIIAKDFL